MRMTARTIALVVTSIFVCLTVAAGCGNDKPAYCGKRDQLEQSINALRDLNVSNLPTDLNSKVQQIVDDARGFANATKDAFPQESQQLEDDVNKLADSVQKVSDSGNVDTGTVVRLTGEVTAVLNSADDLRKKVDEGCS